MPLTHGAHSGLALQSKMFLAFLSPLLDDEQLHALRLTRNEARACVSLLNKALRSPYQIEQQGLNLLTLLKATMWFSHEHHRKDQKMDNETCSECEKKLCSVSNELKLNIQLLVEEGILLVLKALLRSKENIQITATRLIWYLGHDTTAKSRILDDIGIGALQDIYKLPSPELHMASHCALWLLHYKSEGMHVDLRWATLYFILTVSTTANSLHYWKGNIFIM